MLGIHVNYIIKSILILVINVQKIYAQNENFIIII